MQEEKITALVTEDHDIASGCLERTVTISCFLPKEVPYPGQMSLLLINDGQNMEELGLATLLEEMIGRQELGNPLERFVIG